MKNLRIAALSALAGAIGLSIPAVAQAATGDTLKMVRDRGELVCGVHPSRPGFSAPDSKGTWVGFNVDFCKALAAAIFGDANKVRFAALSSQQRFPAIQSGEVDVLARNISSTLSRDTVLGLNFAPALFYTGTGLMVRTETGAKSLADLDGAVVCLAPGGTTERNVARAFTAQGLKYTPVVIENTKQLNSSYMNGRCDALAGDKSSLPGVRAYDSANPADHFILPDTLSKEPHGVAVRQGDEQWYDIVKWTAHALLNAEEMEVSQANVEEKLASDDADIQNLLGVIGESGPQLGLDKKWAYNIVKQVGNYADIYNRHFGPQSPIALERGINSLYTKGGILYGYPLQ